MSKFLKISIPLLCFLLLLLFVFIILYPEARIEVFQGTLEDFNDACAVDVTCSATVDGKFILVHPGMVRELQELELGEMGVWTDDIGKLVEVRAIRTGIKKYTIIGDRGLYIRTIDRTFEE